MTVIHSLPSASLAAGAAIFLAAAVVAKYLLSTRRPRDFPPGPPTILGLGNLHQIPLQQPFRQFQAWAETYGDILGLKVGPMNVVVLRNPVHVREVLERRGASYAGRPYSYIPSEHVFAEHADKHILNLQHDAFLRRWRTAVNHLLATAGVKQCLPILNATAVTLAHSLLDNDNDEDKDPLSHVRHWALATPLLAITGQRLEDRGPGFAARFFDAQHKWLELLEPGNAPPVDFFPFLRWVPEVFADWKTKAREVREYMLDEYFGYLQTAKGLRYGTDEEASSSSGGLKGFRPMLTKVLEDGGPEPTEKSQGKSFTDAEIAYMGGGLLDAAVDTTLASILSFIMFMASYPDVQAQAFEELDQQCPGKVPSAEDLEKLPYLRACLLEIFRLRPPAPTSLPRILDRDDVFHGYNLPKGTTILVNVWGLHQNDDEYEAPDEFCPQRFLLHPLGVKPDALAPDAVHGRRVSYTFGTGRRVCPGEQFAEASLLLALAKVVWAYRIVAPEPLDTSLRGGYATGLALVPKPFRVEFQLRDDARRELLTSEYNAIAL